MAIEFSQCVKEFNILSKIIAITADNAANNNTFLKELEEICVQNETNFHHKKNHVRCLAHIINLTTNEILKHVKAGEARDGIMILEDNSEESS
ncbi:unnamed protein product [Rhizophagus irregularis]|nr:unnamed protein product [Rhizophagus irregularis]